MPYSTVSQLARSPGNNHPPAKRVQATSHRSQTLAQEGAQAAPMAGRSTRTAILANARSRGPCSARPELRNRVKITIPQKSRGQIVPGIPNNDRRSFNLVLTHSTKLNSPLGCALHKAAGRLNLVFGARVTPFEPGCRMIEPTLHKMPRRLPEHRRSEFREPPEA